MKRHLLLFVALILTVWTFTTHAHAATNTNSLRVGVIEMPPIALQNV